MLSGITRGWWFWWTKVMGSLCSLFEQLWFFPQREVTGFTPIQKFLVGVKVLSSFSSRLYSLGDCNVISTWEFCSGPTPGPTEVTGHRAASGRSTLRTGGCPEGGGDQQVHLTSYCLVFSKSIWAVALWGLVLLWYVHTQLRKHARYT